MFSLRFRGSWIRRKDGNLTDDKERAVIFDTIDDADVYATDWKNSNSAHLDNHKIEIVEVACRKVISKVGLVHKEV